MAATEVITIANNWKSIFSMKRIDVSNGTEMTQQTTDGNFAPSEMISSTAPTGGFCAPGGGAAACNLLGPWGNSTVKVISEANDNAVGIQYAGLTISECNNLGNVMLNTTGLVAIQFNGGTKYQFPPLGTTPATTATVSTSCTAANAGGIGNNTVLGEFSLN
jgi:hypothetical protein